MKYFSNFITFVNEGGNTFKNTSPIEATEVAPTLKDLYSYIIPEFKLKDEDFSPIGSTGKKKPGTYSGDIDIALNGLTIGSRFNLHFNEVVDYVYERLKHLFPNLNVNLTKGLGVTNIAFPIHGTDKFVQIDFMVVNDLELAKFFYHSPNFIFDESKYKGIYRTILMYEIVKSMDLDREETYFDDKEFEGKFKGQLKTFKKFTATAHDGIKKQMKSFVGKNGVLKNAQIQREFDEIVTKEPIEIVKIILGQNATISDMNSFESIYHKMQSADFPHKNNFHKVIEDYKIRLKELNLPFPSELKD